MSITVVIEAKLGRGPAGACYLARKAEGGHVVAKVLRQAFFEHPELMARIKADVDRWVGFSDPHVLEVLGWATVQGRSAIVSELAGVGPCSGVLENGPFELREAMRVTRDVGLALANAHRQGLAAGDVRPEKIYFDPQSGARLADLGQSVASCLAGGFGQYGMSFGHPAYLAPEVMQSPLSAPTPGTDVYALGVTFYHLVTGRLPYTGDPRAQLQAHLEQPLPIPSGCGITPEVAKWLLRMTAKHPKRRFTDAVSAINALYEVIGQPPPFPKESTAGDTEGWNNMADESSQTRAGWRESRVEHAEPTAPSDVGERRVSGRLPRMDLMASEEMEPGDARAAAPPAPAKKAAGGKKGDKGKEDQPAALAIRVGQQMGRGPAGTTYDGMLKDHEGQVVIKSLTRRFNKHKDLLKRIMDRVHQADLVKGPRVLQTLGHISAQGRELIVFERAKGPRLREFIAKRGALPMPKALAFMRTLGEALVSAHTVGQVHGDIRPEKIYLDEKGIGTLLTDFGLCRASCLAGNFGALGMHFGHPAYLAPEVIQEGKEEPDVASDMYAAGILLYELIAGVRPFHAKDPKDLLVMHLKATPPPPTDVSVPKPLAELILRLTAKIPERRPQKPSELLDAIGRCQKQVLLTTGLRKAVSVDEFDPTDSGEDARDQLDEWSAEAANQVATTGRWSRSKIADISPVGPDMGNLLASEELSPENNPFAE